MADLSRRGLFGLLGLPLVGAPNPRPFDPADYGPGSTTWAATVADSFRLRLITPNEAAELLGESRRASGHMDYVSWAKKGLPS